GGNGAPALIVLADGSRPHPKSRTTVPSGTRLRMVYPGGGGYGDPRKRAAAAVEDDLRDGYVTTEGARRHYRSVRTCRAKLVCVSASMSAAPSRTSCCTIPGAISSIPASS